MAATSKDSNLYNRQRWESAEFPMLCQTCLGPNPYIRMTKEPFGKECKICARPFTIFRWCPGEDSRFKKTEICQTCAKVKNVCQTCLFDLVYGLPTQVRDAALELKESMPQSDVNKEYFTQNMERQLAGSDGTGPVGELGRAMKASDILMKLARTTPYYKRNRAHICSFWVKGECKRGEECPYRHEMPTDPKDPLAKQNIKDRYYGHNDPVAEKLMRRADAMPKIDPPADQSITTLYVGGVDPAGVAEKDIRDHFYQFGELRTVHVVPRQTCAFVEFVSRDSAQRAIVASHNKLIINGHKLRVLWGRGQATGKQFHEAANAVPMLAPVPGLPGAVPMPTYAAAAAAASAGAGHVHYPSMDPQRMGTHAPRARAEGPGPQ